MSCTTFVIYYYYKCFERNRCLFISIVFYYRPILSVIAQSKLRLFHGTNTIDNIWNKWLLHKKVLCTSFHLSESVLFCTILRWTIECALTTQTDHYTVHSLYTIRYWNNHSAQFTIMFMPISTTRIVLFKRRKHNAWTKFKYLFSTHSFCHSNRIR